MKTKRIRAIPAPLPQTKAAGSLPVWIRAPVKGPEHFSGFTRGKLYELSDRELIQSVTTRGPQQTRGVRLFHLQSILDYIETLKGKAAA
jgi:hypothetical protein